jgi:hypothetical protein
VRVHVYQAFAFSRRTEVLKPGTYKLDRLTAHAIRSSASDLVRQRLVVFEDDADIVPPIVPARDLADEVRAEFERVQDVAEDFNNFSGETHARFDLDPL